MVILVWLIYLFLGLLYVNFFFANKKENFRFYFQAYFVATIFLLIHTFLNDFIHDSTFNSSVHGVYSSDGVFYHQSGLILSRDVLNYSSIDAGWTIAWQYIVAFNYLAFGGNPVFLKIFNVFIFSISAIYMRELARNILDNNLYLNRVYYLFIFFVPLLYNNVDLNRETFISYLILVIIYSSLTLLKTINIKYVFIIIIHFLLLAATRLEYLLIAVFVIMTVFIVKKEAKLFRKLTYISLVTIGIILISSLDIFKTAGITETITGEGGRTRAVAASRDDRTIVTGGPLNVAKQILNSPSRHSRVIIYGTTRFFLFPQPYKWLSSDSFYGFNRFFFHSFYNSILYFLFPALFFGLFYRYQDKLISSIDYILILLISITIIAVSIGLRDPLRYTTPIFHLILFHIAYGQIYYFKWKKYMLFLVLAYLSGAFFFLFLFDLGGVV